MTTMVQERLIALGFNQNEARVYAALVKLGQADAKQLITVTKFHKNINDNLEKLMNKGLVSFFIENGRKVFKIASSMALFELLKEDEQEIQRKKKIAQEIAKEINLTQKLTMHKQQASVYKGISGVRLFYEESLHKGDYVVFGAPKDSVKIMGDYFWENYSLKRKELGIKVKMIFNPSLEKFGKKLQNSITHIKYFEYNFEPLTETHIQQDEVAFVVWSEEPVVFIIKDQFVSEAYKKYFEEMWLKAKS